MKFRALELAKKMFCEIGRIGYPDEGIRLLFGDDVPYNLHFEVQLSREDTEWIIAELQERLKKEKNLQ